MYVLHDLEHIFFFEVLGDDFIKELLNFLTYGWFELGLLNGFKVVSKEQNFWKELVF